jgi:hypothetical protein
MTAQAALPLEQTNPLANGPAQGGLHSRPLLLLERTMYREGRTPFTSVFTVTLVGAMHEENLRRALLTLQSKHELLRSVVEDVDGQPHFVLQDHPAPIPLRIVERDGDDDWQEEVRKEWTVPFAASHEPLARLVWIRGSYTSELILLAHHCICDGQSGMILLQQCLRACDDPEQDLKSVDVLKGIEDLVPASLRNDRRFQRRVHWKMRLLRMGLALKRRDGAEKRTCITSEQMYFQRCRLDARTSTAIAAHSKAQGVTVFAVAAVSFLQAFREIRGKGALRKAYTMVNARRFLSQLTPDALFGIAPGVELCLKELPTGEITKTGFWKGARAIKIGVTRRIDRLGRGMLEYLVGLESLHDKYNRLVGDTEGKSEVRHLTLSNMGRLDLPTQYRTFTLEKVYSPLVMVSPTPANTVVLSSFAGRLEFAIVSDTQSLPQTQAVAILQRAMSILRSCAGVEVSTTPASLTAAGMTGE